ncbi:cytochrome c-type biogenesis protein H [Candidatus Photodesmus blepharus]|uniref:Cytochrome c-type biogenesis protein H n=1 Tax=Candidatus Photodesmus blepharonis TaxID=1179155 RepID=A0A084CMY0_9GAMM|nr:hypothetical protein [Candidatus Photodesmus blepharus]KEY91159.1 cytochrome c-type biogenesis protein H [Candidatus Photodesmus blepharus]
MLFWITSIALILFSSFLLILAIIKQKKTYDCKLLIKESQVLTQTLEKKEQETVVWPVWVLVLSILLMVIFSYGMYAKFGAASKVLDWKKVSDNLPKLSKKIVLDGISSLTDDEMRDFMLSLRTRLHHQAEDVAGWVLLSSIALMNHDLQTSIDAMKRAYVLEPENVDVKSSYARVLMLSQNNLDRNRAHMLFSQLHQK